MSPSANDREFNSASTDSAVAQRTTNIRDVRYRLNRWECIKAKEDVEGP